MNKSSVQIKIMLMLGLLALASVSLIIVGCADKSTTAADDPARFSPLPVPAAHAPLELLGSFAWAESTNSERFQIAFPEGSYRCEADDTFCWYFRAPQKVLFGQIDEAGKGRPTPVAGGIFFVKHPETNGPTAGGYIENKNGKRVPMFNFDDRFNSAKGKKWRFAGD